MRFLIQKVKNLKIADFKINESCLLIYVGISKNDENKDVAQVVDILENLEVLEENGKFQRKIKEIKPKIFLVSQITLLTQFSSKGRPDFSLALEKEKSKKIFEEIVSEFKKRNYETHHTPFGSYLEIESTNLGPVNFIIDL